ncbi:MAG: response regulator [Marivibrio sp.]|uniref:response regulator n=1 Tax=Marivibrio sp. TaxID=2039719 RepID=UPI0032EC1BD2
MNAPLHRDLSVLVIDDQRTMRLIVRQLLRQIGVTRVSEAGDGREAVAKLADREIETPDLVICDLHMEGMDGMAFTAAVRRNKTKLAPETPVLLLTGESDDFVLDVVAQAGATMVLHKPITAGELYQAVSRAIGFQLAGA